MTQVIEYFVGNIAFSATETEVKAFLEGEAAVRIAEVRLLTRDATHGKVSQGCGFVDVWVDRTEDETDASMFKLNGTEFSGRKLKVEHSRRERDRRARLQRGAA